MSSHLAFIAIALPAYLSAQQIPTRTLSNPAEYREPFSSVTAMIEMRDGRVLVADSREKTLQVIDVTTHVATPVGRTGSGPNEWALPLRMIRMPGDTTYVYDILNSRFLLVAPDGRPVRTHNPSGDTPAAPVTRAERGGVAFSLGGFSLGGGITGATTADDRGRMYFQGSPLAGSDANGMPTGADSSPVLRQRLGTGDIDTVAYLRLPSNDPVVRDAGTRGQSLSFRLTPGRPYENGDAWVAFPDGRVVIARVADYHLEVIGPDGKRAGRGAPVRYTPVRITERDKELWRESRRAATPVMVTQGTGAGAHQLPSMPVQDPDTWPEFKSPFATNGMWAAPNGQTWIFPQRAATDRIPVADVFDARGTLVGRVALPADVRVVGLGARGIYAVRTDDDGLQYLQRYSFSWQ
jgi:hypothetical protein